MERETGKRKLNFILHGGDRTEKDRLESIGGQARMYELFPFLKLLAGSLPVQIMKSFMKVWRGQLVCEENRELIGKALPKGWELPKAVLFPAEHFVGRYQIVRGDVEFSAPELLSSDQPLNGGDNRMMAAGQTVISGSYFAHGYHLEHAHKRDIGCLLHSLSLWQQGGGRIGGKSASGHGRLKTQIHIEPMVDIAECVEAYLEHLANNIEPCHQWIEEAFKSPPKEEKPKAKAAKAKAKIEPEPVEGELWEE